MISSDTDANLDAGTPPREARAWALIWLAAYLVMAGVILAAGGAATLAIVHAVLLLIALALASPIGDRAPWRSIGDILPLLVFPALYLELPRLIAVVGSGYHDGMVQRWELALFHAHPSQRFADAIPVTLVSELLHASYIAYYPLIFVPPLLLLVRGRREALGQTMLALAVVYAVCWSIFVVFPVEGPRYLWSVTGVPDGQFRRLALEILAAGSSRGAAFPSSHMAVSVVQTMLAWRWQRRTAYVIAPITVLLGLGAVYGGFHYAVDILAGAALGVVIATLIMLDGVVTGGALSSRPTPSSVAR